MPESEMKGFIGHLGLLEGESEFTFKLKISSVLSEVLFNEISIDLRLLYLYR